MGANDNWQLMINSQISQVSAAHTSSHGSSLIISPQVVEAAVKLVIFAIVLSIMQELMPPLATEPGPVSRTQVAGVSVFNHQQHLVSNHLHHQFFNHTLYHSFNHPHPQGFNHLFELPNPASREQPQRLGLSSSPHVMEAVETNHGYWCVSQEITPLFQKTGYTTMQKDTSPCHP